MHLCTSSRSALLRMVDAGHMIVRPVGRARYGGGMPNETMMQILGHSAMIVEKGCLTARRMSMPGDMVPFITDTDLYITDLCVQIAVQACMAGFIRVALARRWRWGGQVLATSPRMAPQVIERCVPQRQSQI